MENNIIENKLTLPVEYFQEGFDILSKAPSFKEMVKKLLHLMQTNFFISKLCAYHKKDPDSIWEILHPSKNIDLTDISYFNNSTNISIQYFEKQTYDVSIILPLSDKSFLGILIGPKSDNSSFTALDKINLQILLQVFDSAHKSFLNQRKEKALIFDLNEKVVQLNNLIDTVIEVSRYDKRSVLFELALERIASLANASSALLQISGDKVIKQQYCFPQNVNINDILNSEFKINTSFEYNGLSYVFTLSEKETRNGVINFNELDKMLLNAIARQVHASIENQYLNSQAIEKEKMKREIAVAASIQQRILPDALPEINGYDLAGINIPSKEVGGDYYDCINIGKGKYALIIADVTGKGIGAALLVSTLNAALYSYLEFDLPLTVISDKLNKLIYKSSPSDKFITFFIAVLDSGTGELDVVNAGHNPILLLRKNGILEKIDAGGVGLGMFNFGIPYTGQKFVLDSGDKLFLYTDGIPEAMNVNEEEYSDERMVDFLKSQSDKSAEEFITSLVNNVKWFAGLAEQSDDITAFYLIRR